MNEKKSRSQLLKPVEVAVSAIFSALVCIATIIFTVYVPQTRGFFNIGETMVYITALLFGPLVGGIAGGFGSMLADIILGYFQYAPATLLIKMGEGAVVGFLTRKRPKKALERYWKLITVLLSIIVGALLAVIGSNYYSGVVEIYFGASENPSFASHIPREVWYIIGGAVSISLIVGGLKLEPELGWTIFSIIVGGLIMVTGYFLYEFFFLVHEAAYVEIPVNIGQMTVGLTVALPVVRAVRRYIPSIRGSSG